MDLEEFQVGNLVRYTGPLYEYRDNLAKILEFDNSVENETFQLEVSNYKGEINRIVAYRDGVQAVYLHQDFLLKHGFSYDDKAKTFTKDGLKIMRVGWVERDGSAHAHETDLRMVDKGFGIVNEEISQPITDPKEILSKVTLLNTIQSLQNYYTFVLGEEFEQGQS